MKIIAVYTQLKQLRNEVKIIAVYTQLKQLRNEAVEK